MVAYVFQEGDTVGSIAARFGLASWRDIWNAPANDAIVMRRHAPYRLRPGDELEVPGVTVERWFRGLATGIQHRFARNTAANARIVDDGGDPRTAAAGELRTLAVSPRVTTRELPAGFLDPSDDRLNFKVEVRDPRIPAGQNDIRGMVTVEALSPGRGEPISAPVTLQELARRFEIDDPATIRNHPRNADLAWSAARPDEVPIGVVWIPFDPDPRDFAAPRTLAVDVARVPGTSIFRSRYLRLVVDNRDHQANEQQTLLTDWDPHDTEVDILGQHVRVRYRAVSGEEVAARAVVGRDPRRVRIAVHIVRNQPGAAPPVQTVDVRMRLWRFLRRYYAQINVAPHLVHIGNLDPARNVLTVSNLTGARASHTPGTVMISLRTLPDNANWIIGPIQQLPDALPLDTANLLATRLRAQGFTVVVSENAATAEPNVTRGSVDLILTRAGAADVVIDRVDSTDPSQRVRFADGDPAHLRGMGVQNRRDWNVGSIDQRALIYRANRAPGRIDVFVVAHLGVTDVTGQALMRATWQHATRPAHDNVAHCVFLNQENMDPTTDHPKVLAHELLHVLLDAAHADHDTTQVMTPIEDNHGDAVGSDKRISERARHFDAPAGPILQHERLRQRGALEHLLEPFI